MKLPDYDRHSGENVFRWILRTANEVRADRKAERLIDVLSKQVSNKARTAHDAALDAEDVERIRAIRKKYGRKGR